MKADKIKKMEELRKRLLQLDSNEWEEVLDTSSDKEQWRIDISERMRIDNMAFKPEVKIKMSQAAKQRHKHGWASPVKYEWTPENNPNKGGLKGEENPVYGKGALYKELTSGFEGTFLDMKNKFPGFSLGLVDRKRIRKDSPYPDCVWVKTREACMSKNNQPKDFGQRVSKGKKKMHIEVFVNNKLIVTGDVTQASKTAGISEWQVYQHIKLNKVSKDGFYFKKVEGK